jgi:hypothetical protein
MANYEQYIRQAAIQRGIDPDIAVSVARSEGGTEGYIQSRVRKNGVQEPSFGPFQMLVGGGGSGFPVGMGNDFQMRTGLDPRDPANAERSIDFALDQAKMAGWSPWFGAKAIGVTGMEGIGGRPAAGVSQPSSSPYAGMADGPKGQEAYPAPVMGSMMAGSPQPQQQQATSPIPAAAQALANPQASANNIFGMMAAQPQQQAQFSPVQIMGPSPEQANALSSLIAALTNRTAI